MNFFEILASKGYEIEDDDGVVLNIDGEEIKVRCSYVGTYRREKLLCIDLTSPLTLSSMITFIKSYARIAKIPFAILHDGEKVAVYDLTSDRELGIDEIPDPEKALEIKSHMENSINIEKDKRVAAAYFSVIHCSSCSRCEVNK
jgi:hypothetical protein